jgi:hypothetical protein
MKALILPLILLAAPAAVFAQTVQTIDAATQTRLQIVTAPIGKAQAQNGVSGYATVIDPAPLLGLISDLSAARAAAVASSAEAARLKALSGDASVSARSAEAAKAQAAADQAKVTLLQQQIMLQTGPAVARLASTAFASELASGQAALVRVDTPSGRGQMSASTVRLHTGNGDVEAKVLGVARAADAKLQSPGLIVLARGEAARWLTPGLTLTAQIYGGGTSGLLIPNNALLRQDGQVFAYVRTAPTRFERRTVHFLRATPDGLIVQDGFQPGERVVVQGASALYVATAAPADGDD